MTEDGKIEWQRFDADDEATHPDTGKELPELPADLTLNGYAA